MLIKHYLHIYLYKLCLNTAPAFYIPIENVTYDVNKLQHRKNSKTAGPAGQKTEASWEEKAEIEEIPTVQDTPAFQASVSSVYLLWILKNKFEAKDITK